jgi:hypothetical protein
MGFNTGLSWVVFNTEWVCVEEIFGAFQFFLYFSDLLLSFGAFEFGDLCDSIFCFVDLFSDDFWGLFEVSHEMWLE